MALPTSTGSVNTTNATVTTVLTIPVVANAVLGIDGYVIARRSGGSAGATNDGAFYKVAIVATNTGGTAALIGNDIEAVGEIQTLWDVSVTTSGANVLIQVTGAVNNNISWTGYVQLLSQT